MTGNRTRTMRRTFFYRLLPLAALAVLFAAPRVRGQAVPPVQPVPSTGSAQDRPPVIGGSTDAGGCLTGAGYSFCPALNECVRVWETPCPRACAAKLAELVKEGRCGGMMVGGYCPQCDDAGDYEKQQCWGSTGYVNSQEA
ncbi:hypothetical protein DFJ74DRAFT_678707 [Hyaloraphidium curvatum]|nr:hypothetical protein DFJ74DRAFT_678707 [Hyaloraphidium curvatum]